MLLAACYWLIFYGALWILLTGASGWGFALPSIILASLLTLHLRIKPWLPRPRPLLFCMLHLLHYALRGALEVAAISLGKRGGAQQWLSYSFASRDSRAQLLLASCVSLLPGALSAEVRNDCLHFHVLDSAVDWPLRVAQLETQIARLFVATPLSGDEEAP